MSTLMSYCGSVNLGQPSLRGERKREKEKEGEEEQGKEEKGEGEGRGRREREKGEGGRGGEGKGGKGYRSEEAGGGEGTRKRWKYFQTVKMLSFTLAHLGKTVIHSGNVEVSFNAS